MDRQLEYWGYCTQCEETKPMVVEDFGVAPEHHDWQIVCPVDEEHEVTGTEAHDPREDDHDRW